MLLGIYGAYVTTHPIAADASLISELSEVRRGGERGRKDFGKGSRAFRKQP